VRGRRNETLPFPNDDDVSSSRGALMEGLDEDETGPCDGVKGAVDAYDPPLEARVPRLDRCCLKQKVGYSRDAAPKNNPNGSPLVQSSCSLNHSRTRGFCESYKKIFLRSIFCLGAIPRLFFRDGLVIGSPCHF
jgi:hypothetical protein